MASDALLDNVGSHGAHRALGFEEVERLILTAGEDCLTRRRGGRGDESSVCSASFARGILYTEKPGAVEGGFSALVGLQSVTSMEAH